MKPYLLVVTKKKKLKLSKRSIILQQQIHNFTTNTSHNPSSTLAQNIHYEISVISSSYMVDSDNTPLMKVKAGGLV